jgi:hypothetical protein
MIVTQIRGALVEHLALQRNGTLPIVSQRGLRAWLPGPAAFEFLAAEMGWTECLSLD